MTLPLLDYIFLGLLVLSLVLGLLRGAVKEGYSLSARILSFLGALVLSLSLTDYLNPRVSFMKIPYFYTFLFLYITISFLLLVIMTKILKKDRDYKISLPSRFTGALLGLFSGVFFVVLASWILMSQTWFDLEKLFTGDLRIYPRVVEFLLVFMSYYG